MNINTFYEDNHIIIIEKPYGILSQKDFTNNDSIIEILKDYLKHKYNKPGNVYIGSLHRLDKNVSGIMVFAKTSKAASRISDIIRKKQLHKFYISINESNKSVNRSEWEKIENHVVRNKDFTICYDTKKDNSKISILYYKTITSNEKYSINIIYLETGRKHQIRATFSNMDSPVIGDNHYRSKYVIENNNILLYSSSLIFEHPVKKTPLFFYNRPVFLDQYFHNINDDDIKNEIRFFMKIFKKTDYSLSILDN